MATSVFLPHFPQRLRRYLCKYETLTSCTNLLKNILQKCGAIIITIHGHSHTKKQAVLHLSSTK